MASVKGLILLEAKNSILFEHLNARLLEGKKEAAEIIVSDFDDVSYKVVSTPEEPHIVRLFLHMKTLPELKKIGSQTILDRLFPGMEIPAEKNYHLGLRFDTTAIPNPAQFLINICEIKRNMLAGPMDKAFDALLAKTSANLQTMIVDYRKSESLFVCPMASKVVVVFSVNFSDETDRAFAKVFLQEFVEAQRSVRTAPPVSFSKDPPGELAGAPYAFKPEVVGYISFSIEERHVSGANKEKAMSLLTGFRPYLMYHIKCSKTYLHMRMRRRVDNWMLVLNRAVPEVEGEKKTASGKTFSRK